MGLFSRFWHWIKGDDDEEGKEDREEREDEESEEDEEEYDPSDYWEEDFGDIHETDEDGRREWDAYYEIDTDEGLIAGEMTIYSTVDNLPMAIISRLPHLDTDDMERVRVWSDGALVYDSFGGYDYDDDEEEDDDSEDF